MNATIALLNAWGAVWSGLMLRSLVEASALLLVILLAWLPLRRRVPSQLTCGLFLLVLVKAAVPLPVTLPESVAWLSPWRALDRLAGLSPPDVAGPPRTSPITSPVKPAPFAQAVGEGAPAASREAQVRPESSGTPGRGPVARTSTVTAGLKRPAPSLLASALLMVAWGMVVAGLLVRFVGVHVRMSERLRAAERLDPARLPLDYDRLCRSCGLRTIPLVTTPWIPAPAVWGLVRPRVLLPPGLAETLAPGQLTWVLLHELVHIRRRDTWVVTFQRLVQIAYVFHPAVWVANRLIDVHREFACDDAALALALAGDIPRRDCGAAFLAVLERASSHAKPGSALGLFGSHTLVRRRLMRILDSQRPLHRRLSARAALFLGASALLVLPHVRAQDRPAALAEPQAKPAPADAAQGRQRSLDFRVVDLRTNGPLKDVTVRAQVNGVLARGKTDDQGRFPVMVPAGRPVYLTIWASLAGYVPVSVAWNRDAPVDPPQDYTLKLEPGTTIGGIIQDEEGKPVEGATVSLLVPGETVPGRPRTDVWDYPAKTDAQGRWRCDILPQAFDDIWIRLSHREYQSDTSYGATPKPPMDRLRDRSGVMVMKKGVTVAGRVLDTEGKPIKGARVAQGSDRHGTHHPETRTDAEGRFEFKNVGRGELILTVQAEGHAPDLKRLEVPTETADVEFRLGPGRTIRGRVVDGRGQPLPGAMVAADSWRGHRSLAYRVNTDDAGRWRWDEAPGDEVLFDFGQEGFFYARRRPLAASDHEQTIGLVPVLTVRGAVSDAETGRPIDRFIVLAGSDWGGGRQPHFQRADNGPSTGGRYEVRFHEPRAQHFVRIQAEGYLPETSRGFKDDEGKQVFDFKLRRIVALNGVARLPDGSPLAGADVVLMTATGGPTLIDGRLANRRGLTMITTGPDGRFRLPTLAGPASVIVLHDRGVARRTDKELAANPDIRVEPWGRVEGTFSSGSKPAPDREVDAYASAFFDRESPVPLPHYSTRTDAAGRFVMERVIPGAFTFHRTTPVPGEGAFWTHRVKVDIVPGTTTFVALGGTGRTVLGRAVGPGRTSLAPDLVHVQIGLLTGSLRTDQYGVEIAPDGTLRAEDVPPGRYTLALSLSRRIDYSPSAARALGHREVNIPAVAAGQADEPYNLGDIELNPQNFPTVAIGQPVPALEASSLDGKPLRLADLRGKFVLLVFWATWSPPCLEETPHLKAAFAAFGKDERFAMLALSLDPDRAAPRRYAEDERLGWPQGFLGQGKEPTATADLGVQLIPSTWLIGPDGKLIARDLRGAAIEEAVGRALKEAR